MRHRRIKGVEERMTEFGHLLLEPARENSGAQGADGEGVLREDGWEGKPVRWHERRLVPHLLPEGFSAVYVEIGCGRGRFLNELAASDPDGLYIGIEGCVSAVFRAMQKSGAAGLPNTRYIADYVNDVRDVFARDSIDGIYLNFSDPWPKDRHARRRLTYSTNVAAYRCVLKNGGFLEFKTDGEAFFDYSRGQLRDAGFVPEFETRDLRGANSGQSIGMGDSCGLRAIPPNRIDLPDSFTDIPDRINLAAVRFQTEYESRFIAEGKPIFCLRVRK